MAKSWRLTPRARASFSEIFDWTRATFGDNQADAYAERLIEACAAVATGESHVRDCSMLLRRPSAAAYRFARAGEHFIIYRESESGIAIVDFLHARSDVSRALVELMEAEKLG